jgi:chloramphenicol 3-O phosphotransferase
VVPGRVVLLNGPSSAGKTTLAAAVAALLPTPWHVFPVDLVHAVRSRPDRHGHPVADLPAMLRTSRAGYHRALAGLARGGCDVIGDHVLSEPWRLADLLSVTEGLDVLLVHVTASPAELAAREAARGDRDLGAALAQLELVFAHGDCDLAVDTSAAPIEVCAAAVVALLDVPPEVTAFERLREDRR